MASVGTLDINLSNFGDMVNNSSKLGSEVTGGVADQGSLIGLAIGIAIAITLLFGVILLVLGYIVKLIKEVKGMKHA
jgi:hypothetical protein